jgi:nitrogen regulatory protein P-II 1
MKRIEAIVRPDKLDAIVDGLLQIGHQGLNFTEVKGHGRQRGMKEIFRGREYEIRYIPKVKIELVVNDALVERAIGVIIAAAKTGQIGDGKIFVSDVADVVRVRTGERGELAV